MFNYIRNKINNDKAPKTIIIKPEIDYDQLADKLAKAIIKYQSPNILSKDNNEDIIVQSIIEKTIIAKETSDIIDDKEPLSDSSVTMQNTLLFLYIIIYSIGVAGCIVYCYNNILHGIGLSKWWYFPMFFSCISLLSVIISKQTYECKNNKSIKEHFEYINVMATLFLAILALK